MKQTIFSTSNDVEVRHAINDLVRASHHDHFAQSFINERLDAWIAGESDESKIKKLEEEIEDLKCENNDYEKRISSALSELE